MKQQAILESKLTHLRNILLSGALLLAPSVWAHPDGGYPRILGMNIGAKNYADTQYQAQLARTDVVILGFYKGWGSEKGPTAIRAAVQSLKRLNPRLLVGQYTILSEAYEHTRPTDADYDKTRILDQQDWWLRNARGEKTQWTDAYSAWDTNITEWTKPDPRGRRYPEWLAERDYTTYFLGVPEFDIWYLDNVTDRPYSARADWTKDGIDDSNTDSRITQSHRRAHASEWARARSLSSRLLLMANADNDLSLPEYRGRLNGVFLEALMGKSWSLETWGGWEKMMARYRGVTSNLRAPAIVAFNVWGKPTDYRLLRYALASSLLENGYFSFTDMNKGYSSVPWFDEYEVNLGKPAESPQRIAWNNGVFRRKFQRGMVLVNPTLQTREVSVPAGYKRLKGTQDPTTNDGMPVTKVVLPPKDGLVLVPAP